MTFVHIDAGEVPFPVAPAVLAAEALAIAPAGFAVTDLDGRFVHVSEPLCGLLGRTDAELLGSSVFDLVRSIATAPARRALERLAAGLQDAAHEHVTVACPDGGWMRMHIDAAPLRGRDGMPYAVASWWRDRTADADAESALQAATEQLGVLAGSCPLGVYLVDLDGVVRSWNDGAERIFGWTAEETIGRRLPFVPPGEHHTFEMMRWRMVDGMRFPGLEVARIRKDGTTVDISVSAAAVRDADGDVVAIMGISEDISARTAAEQAVRTSEHRLAAILANVTDTVSLVDRRGTILQTSRGTDRILGYPASFWDGRSLLEVTHPDDLEGGLALLQRVLDEPGVVHRGEFRGRHADGSWTWVEVVGVNRLDDPEIGAIVMTSRNVDARRRAEALQACQARTLELIARSARLDETLGAVVALVEELVPGSTARVLLESDDDPSEVPDATWLVPVVAESTGARLGAIATMLDGGRTPSDHDHRVLDTAARLAAIAVERADAELRLAHQATHDSLTGLPNRTLLLDRMEHALARAGRSGRGVAVLFCDLDRFKVLNDSLGHGIGDLVLFEVARRLTAVVRPGDTVARFGGDEFVILCEEVDGSEHCSRIAERVRAALAEPVTALDDSVVLTASVGIALAEKPSVSPDGLLRDADAAMYRAKELGRDRHELFDDDMRSRAHACLRLEADLRRAIDADELRVLFQPLVDLGTGKITGAEALVRWQHPERGLLTPDEFIPLAEETGLVVPLGWWVLDRAVAAASTWRCSDGRPLLVSVNLSGRQLFAPGIAQEVADVLERHRFPAERLSLELTESVLVDTPGAAAALAQLKALGVHVALDDFGTGYSSLSYLHQLPVDVVKVDRAFIDGLDGGSARSAIATAIVQVCDALGLASSAEGVERPEQLARLRELGVTSGQGWLFGRPVDPEAFEQLLQADPAW